MLKRNKITDNLEEIQKNNTREQEVQQALKKEDGLAWEQDGIIYIEERIYISNNKKLRKWILQKNHDFVNVDHPEQQKIMELVKQNYWWSGLKKDIKKYVQECFKCQQNKVQHQWKSEELHPLEILQELWQEISIDIIEPLPRSNGIDAIVVIVDQFMKMIQLKVTTTNTSLKGVVKIYKDKIWKLHGIPRKILSNRGPQFTSKFIEEFTKVLGTTGQLSIAYHSQTDSQTERINQEVGTFL